jgi:transcriptional regulator with XRE-family HTH domain
MADAASPLVQRRRLRTELRRARQAKGLTQEQVAREMEWSLSKMIRIENATTGISTNDLKALLPLYDVTDDERTDHLVTLARAARARSWWSGYRDVAPPALLQLIEYESAAAAIRQFETMFIPGILQTEEYARAVIEDYYDENRASERVNALVELRTRREELLDRENAAPRFSFVLDEPVVRRAVGSPAIMSRQLRRLIEAAELGNVTVEVVPFGSGLHPGMKGPFEIVEFADDPDQKVVFLESPRGDIVSDDPEETASYLEAFKQIRKASLDPRESVDYLRQIADEMLSSLGSRHA